MGWLAPVAALCAASCLFFLLRRMKKMAAKARAPRTASPPTTPPTMAPMFDLDFVTGATTDPAAGEVVAAGGEAEALVLGLPSLFVLLLSPFVPLLGAEVGAVVDWEV